MSIEALIVVVAIALAFTYINGFRAPRITRGFQ